MFTILILVYSELSESKSVCKRSLKLYHKDYSEERLMVPLNNKKQYLKLIKECKHTYNKQIQFALANTKNNIEFWKVIKTLCPKQNLLNEINIMEWEDIYIQQYPFNSLDTPESTYIDCSHPFFDAPITHNELMISIAKCKNIKAPGNDGLSNEFYKSLSLNWIHYV